MFDVHENIIHQIPHGTIRDRDGPPEQDQAADHDAPPEQDQADRDGQPEQDQADRDGQPEEDQADRDGPVYDGPVQILGPGFAPFKPYLRPRFFYLRVRCHLWHLHNFKLT